MVCSAWDTSSIYLGHFQCNSGRPVRDTNQILDVFNYVNFHRCVKFTSTKNRADQTVSAGKASPLPDVLHPLIADS